MPFLQRAPLGLGPWAKFRRARDGLDEHATGSYTEWASATFLDDRWRTYTAADYEHVLVRAVLAAVDLMAGGHDAYAYGFQVLEKQQELIRGFFPFAPPDALERTKDRRVTQFVRGEAGERLREMQAARG